ncbi:hypothetical protein H0E87_008575 [Populus deltoides]|uniref:NAC domain-containing protein n=1 Tax=Populus deltoides TaxID=3696 RepID=A0A8T2Z1C6_POPDE|nr:hypothetical protein H0E87_008575 [Populus deltoides]
MSSGVPAVAAGYRFCPMDEDLVVYYLKRKILGEQLPANIIPTTDVYASSPDKLPLGLFQLGQANEWFFFSTKSKDDDITVIDGGYYEIDPDGAAPITWEGKIVGHVKTLFFYQGSPPNGTDTEWMVEEFRINPEFVPVDKADHTTQEKITNLVVCKIYRMRPLPEP